MSARKTEGVPRRRGRLARWAVRLGLALLVLLAALLCVYAARERLLAPLVISRAKEIAREATGLDLQVERVRGNWWSDLELLGVRLVDGTPSTELTSVSIGRLHARYDLLRLLRGDLGAVEVVELDSASVVLDLDRPLPRARRDDATAEPPPFPWPELVPPLRVRDSFVSLGVGGGGRLEARGIDIDSLGPAGGASVEWGVRAKSAGYVDPWFGERDAALAARVLYRKGVLESPLLELEGGRFAHDLHCDLRDVARGEFSFKGVLDLYGGAQEVRGTVGKSAIELWVDTHEVELAALLADLRVPGTWGGRASVGGILRVPFASPRSWSARAWGNATELVFGDRRIDFARFAGSFDACRVQVGEGTLARGANTLQLADFSASIESLELDDVLRSFSGSAQLEVLEPRAILDRAAVDVLSAADRVLRADLAVHFRPRGLDVQRGELQTELGGLTVQRGRATWGARELPWYEGLAVDVDVALAFDDIAPLAALFNRGEAGGSLAGTATLRGPLLRPSGSFLLDGEGLRVSGLELGHVSVDARADQEKLEVAKLEIAGGLGQASVSGGFDYASGTISGARVAAQSSALATLTGGRISAGEVQLEATVAGPWRAPEASARVHAVKLALAGRTVETLDVEGTYREGCARIERLAGKVEDVDVEAAGSVCRDAASGTWRASLQSARLARGELDLALEAPLEVALSPEKLVVQDLRVGGSAGRATLDVAWSEDEQQISIDAAELYPMQLLRPFLPSGVEIEGVQGTLSLHRTRTSLEADAVLRVDKLRPYADTPPASLAVRARFADRTLVIAELALSAPDHYALAVSGRLPTDPLSGEWLADGPVELYGDASIADLASLPWRTLGLESTWSGEVRAEFRLTGESSDLRGTVDAKLDVARTAPESILGRARLDAFQFEGRATLGEEIRLDNARFSVPGRASAILDGRLATRLSPRDWLRTGTFDWRAIPADLGAIVSAQDLGFVADLSSAAVRRTGGSVDGELRLGGTLGDPTATGTIELAHGEVRLNNDLAAFENLSAHLEFDGERVRLASLSGDYGAAPFTASGVIEFGDAEPRLDVHVEGKGLLVAREAGLRVRADADLKLAGNLSALALSGEVVVVDGRFSREFALLTLPGSTHSRRTSELELPFLRRAPWANIAFDVGVTAKKPLRVETNVARGTVQPTLRLAGSGAAPRLGGTVLIGSTRVKLPAATLEVVSGVLTFRGGSSLAPDLDITALTRVRGYDITAQVGGTSLDPELLFTSSPPLASEELAVLVLTGQLPESALSATGGEAAAQTVVVYLGRDLLTRWLGVEGDSEDPISERLEFYRGAEVSQTGIESTEFIFRLTPNPKGKTTIVYLRAEEDIYQRTNYGVKFLFRFR